MRKDLLASLEVVVTVLNASLILAIQNSVDCVAQKDALCVVVRCFMVTSDAVPNDSAEALDQ